MLNVYFDPLTAKRRSFKDGGGSRKQQGLGEMVQIQPKFEMGGAVGWGAGGVHVTHPDSLSTPQMRSAT